MMENDNNGIPCEEVTYRKSVVDWLQRIHEQTSKTNGRVTKLESWQNKIIGGMAVLTTLVVPILLYGINQYLHAK